MHVHMRVRVRVEARGHQIPLRVGVTDDHETLCGSWEPDPGPTQGQPGLLTSAPSLPPLMIDLTDSISETPFPPVTEICD